MVKDLTLRLWTRLSKRKRRLVALDIACCGHEAKCRAMEFIMSGGSSAALTEIGHRVWDVSQRYGISRDEIITAVRDAPHVSSKTCRKVVKRCGFYDEIEPDVVKVFRIMGS